METVCSGPCMQPPARSNTFKPSLFPRRLALPLALNLLPAFDNIRPSAPTINLLCRQLTYTDEPKLD